MELLPPKQTRIHIAPLKRHVIVQDLAQCGRGRGKRAGTSANYQMAPRTECKQMPTTPEQQSVSSFCSSGLSSCFSSSTFFVFSVLVHLSNQPCLGSSGQSPHKAGLHAAEYSREGGSPQSRRLPCSPGTYQPTGKLSGIVNVPPG